MEAFAQGTQSNYDSNVLFDTVLRALSDLGDGLFVVENGRITFANPAVCKMLGYSEQELLDLPDVFDIWHPDEREKIRRNHQRRLAGESFENCYETVLLHRDRHSIDIEISAIRLISGNHVGVVCSVRNITARKLAERKLIHLSHYDELTGLANRGFFIDSLSKAIARAKRTGKMVGLFFLDLDGFKEINDSYGHDKGDLLLKEIARRLTSCVREGDTLSRLGGDEFTLFIEDIEHPSQCIAFAQKILSSVSLPIGLGVSHDVQITTSIGISTFPESGSDVSSLIKNADIAMYRAKQEGRNNFQFCTRDMQDMVIRHNKIENELRNSVKHRQFNLVYQPQLHLQTGKTVAVEALLRWLHPDFGAMSPLEFIRILEGTGLINDIGEWVLQSACRQLRLWQEDGTASPLLSVAVNISSRHFRNGNMADTVLRILRDEKINPSCLSLEITECVMTEDEKIITDIIKNLGRQGVRITLDNFGAGSFSLRYFKFFPLSALKIDKSFVQDCLTNYRSAAIIEAAVSLARAIGVTAIAEGVETARQADFLRGCRCDIIQGYYISYPAAPDVTAAFLRSHKS